MNKILRKTVRIFESASQYPSERRYHEQFSGFQSGRDNLLAKFGQVVFVCSSDFFDKAVRMKPFEHTRYLHCRKDMHKAGTGTASFPQHSIYREWCWSKQYGQNRE